jgi:hypothetical protein
MKSLRNEVADFIGAFPWGRQTVDTLQQVFDIAANRRRRAAKESGKSPKLQYTNL